MLIVRCCLHVVHEMLSTLSPVADLQPLEMPASELMCKIQVCETLQSRWFEKGCQCSSLMSLSIIGSRYDKDLRFVDVIY